MIVEMILSAHVIPFSVALSVVVENKMRDDFRNSKWTSSNADVAYSLERHLT